jgi:NAD(P)H-hydrate epimerase
MPTDIERAQLGALTSADVTALDAAAAELGVTTLQLMEIAGWQVARCAWQRLGAPGAVLVVAGRGNNGGDGLVAARHLATWGCTVRARVLSAEDRLGELLLGHVLSARANGVTVDADADPSDLAARASDATLVIDSLLGTGLREPAREPLATAIRAINDFDRLVLSVDVPSGLDATTGSAYEPCVQATMTCTLTAMKAGLWEESGRRHAGEIWVGDIGMPAAAWRLCGLSPPPAVAGGVLVPIPSATSP